MIQRGIIEFARNQIQELSWHTGIVKDSALDSEANQLFSCSNDTKIIVWQENKAGKWERQ